MSVGAVGSGNANAALWAKLQESMQSRKAEGAETKEESSQAPSAPAYHRVSGASPSSGGSMINILV